MPIITVCVKNLNIYTALREYISQWRTQHKGARLHLQPCPLMLCSLLWLKDNFDTIIFLVFEDIVSMRSIIQFHGMRNHKRWINLAFLDTL